jgi:hypothetical protein
VCGLVVRTHTKKYLNDDGQICDGHPHTTSPASFKNPKR